MYMAGKSSQRAVAGVPLLRVVVPLVLITIPVAFAANAVAQDASEQANGSDRDTFSLANEPAGWRVRYGRDGQIRQLQFRYGSRWQTIAFHSPRAADEYKLVAPTGPQWYGIWAGRLRSVPLQPVDGSTTRFEGHLGDVTFSLEYADVEHRLALIATLRNDEDDSFAPTKVGLKLGFDCRDGLSTTPDGLEVDQPASPMFPTLLRCEQTHFFGYAMNRSGDLLALASPDAVASWSFDYTIDRPPFGGRPASEAEVTTFNLDLLHTSPLPARHPADRGRVPAGNEYRWTIYLMPLDDVAQFAPAVSRLCRVPMFDVERQTVAQGEPVRFRVHCPDEVVVRAIPPSYRMRMLPAVSRQGDTYEYRYQPDAWPGEYRLVATSRSGHRSEARVYVRRPWSWYVKRGQGAEGRERGAGYRGQGEEDFGETRGRLVLPKDLSTISSGDLTARAAEVAKRAWLTRGELDEERRADCVFSVRRLLDAQRCRMAAVVPDCRMHQATLQPLWPDEAMGVGSAITVAPHVSTVSRVYALWYLYQLTGDTQCLRDTLETLGTCAQLIEAETGIRRWAFVVDPYVEPRVASLDKRKTNGVLRKPESSAEETARRIAFGEKYLACGDHGVASQRDEQVEAVFACLNEIAATSAYVVEQGDGRLIGYNCRVRPLGNRLEVVPSEATVNRVHVDVRFPWNVSIRFGNKPEPVVFRNVQGRRWLECKAENEKLEAEELKTDDGGAASG